MPDIGEPPDRVLEMLTVDGSTWMGELTYRKRATLARLVGDVLLGRFQRLWPDDRPGDVFWRTRYWPTRGGVRKVLLSPEFDHQHDARAWRAAVAADLVRGQTPQGTPPRPDRFDPLHRAVVKRFRRRQQSDGRRQPGVSAD